MKLDEFDFYLPNERIARFPAYQRDGSKLMLVDRKRGKISHHQITDIFTLTDEKDFFVINNSKVVPVKLFGNIEGKTVEVLLLRDLDDFNYEAYTLPAKKFKQGVEVNFDNNLTAFVEAVEQMGKRILSFNKSKKDIMEQGFAPLPPYIKRKYNEAREFRNFDLSRYQTVYAKYPGSIAAPTAGLHFSEKIIRQLESRNKIIQITLKVGEATFQKMKVENITHHKMGQEHIRITRGNINEIIEQKETKQLIAIGTTTVRALESWALKKPEHEEFISELFIFPGFKFNLVDKLITNFHLPKSSLFILVSAFAGLDLMKEAYSIAVSEKYNFFSYGDAMLII